MNKKILNVLLVIIFSIIILVIFLFLIKIENKQKNIIWKIDDHLILIDNNKKLDNKKMLIEYQNKKLESEFKLLTTMNETNIYELNINYDFKNLKNEIEIILDDITLLSFLFLKGGKNY